MAQPLDLETCRQMALENNKKVSIARLEQTKARYEVKVYKSNFLPKISASGGYLVSTGGREFTLAGGFLPTFVPSADGTLKPNLMLGLDGRPIIGPDGNPVFKQYAYMPDTKLDIRLNGAYMAGIRLEQPIYMGGKISAASRMATLAGEISEVNLRRTTDEVILETDQAYWQYIKVRELVIVSTKYMDVVQELLRNVTNATQVGMTGQSSLLKVRTKLNEAKLMLRKAQNGERLARMNLLHVIGLEQQTLVEIADNMPDDSITCPRFLGDDISARPEMAMLDRQVEITNEQIRLSRSEFLPNIGIIGGYGFAGGGAFNHETLTGNGSFSAAVAVSVPIFHWGEGRNKVRSAQTQHEITRLQKAQSEQLMSLEANKAFNEYEEAYYRIELTRESLAAALENMTTLGNNYETGMETLSDYLEAQTLWQQAWSDHVEAKAMFYTSRTYYLKSIGKLTYDIPRSTSASDSKPRTYLGN